MFSLFAQAVNSAKASVAATAQAAAKATAATAGPAPVGPATPGGAPAPPPLYPMDQSTAYMPPQFSTVAPTIDWAFDVVLWISIVLFVLTIGVMLYLIWRYRARPGHQVEPSPHHNNALEIGWTLPTIPIVAVIFYVGVDGFVDMRTMPNNALEIKVVAKKWNWTFEYPGGIFHSELHVPKDRDVVLTMRSDDVIHSLYLPVCRVKQDVVPGRFSKLWFNATVASESVLFCTEYCGTDHSRMYTKFVVHESGGYEKFLVEAADWRPRMPPLEAGKMLYETRGCAGCHSADGGAKTGPTFKGSFGTSRDYTGPAGAGKVVMDENYVRESILLPGAKIRAGFNPVMPTYQGQLKDYDIDAIITYIQSLK
ncbi:MAG TPA: cytochrome c oxidase subunit II [Planctomycetia bacterium]|nr:cytochrome c oxidase subunit II [Planctomycetia bacterium]